MAFLKVKSILSVSFNLYVVFLDLDGFPKSKKDSDRIIYLLYGFPKSEKQSACII